MMKYTFAALCCLYVIVVGGVAAQGDLNCSESVDIAVLLDTSLYFGTENYLQLKFFAKNFVSYFELTDSGLNPFIGFIPYADSVVRKRVINFRHSTSVKRLQDKIDGLDFHGAWGTHLDLALKYAREELFTINKGSRSWVPHAILAITGSVQYWDPVRKAAVREEVSLLRRSGIQLVIASVDRTQGNEGYLRSLVDTREHLYIMSQPYLLNTISKKIKRQVCPVPNTLGCPGKVDVAFIVDSSGSISFPDYNKIKYFIFSIAKSLNISENGARAGIVIYSKTAEMVVKFSDHTDIKSFREVVYGLKHMKSFTRIDLGLQVAHTQLFSPVYGGARPGVKKLAFILTDGKQTSVDGLQISLKQAARPLLDSGVKTLSVGIGASVERQELRAMVEYDQDVITTQNFDQLIKNINNITQQICEEITITACKLAADVVFLVDSSSGVSYRDFQARKSFVIAVEKRFKISEIGSRHGVVVYGSRAAMSVGMNTASNSTEFAKAVDRLSLIGGQRTSFRALELAENALFGSGARRNAPKVVVMVTDGVESSLSSRAYLKQVAKRLRDQDVIIKVVGIGSVLRQNELLPLVASSADIFRPRSFDDLKDERAALSSSICEDIGPSRCDKILDIAFIVDSSGSIMTDEFLEARNFVEAIADLLTISPQNTHVGLMTYSDQARIVAKFNQIQSDNDLVSQLNNLPHLRGKTRIDLALKLASSDLFTRNGGMRLSALVPKVALVITDGRQSPAADAIRLDEAVAPLLVRGVKVLAVGVGDRIDREELKMMVKSPEMAFWAKSYRALRVQLAAIARKLCQ